MYDLVTFDVFDTLVHRKVRAPVDVFEGVRLSVLQKPVALLNHDVLSRFSHQRMQAERESREILKAASGGEGEVRLDEIYDRYEAVSGCNRELRDLLQASELRIERSMLFASKEGSEKFSALKFRAKQTAFISDMYLPSEWLLQMLEDVGYTNARSLPIFVSGEFRKSKHSGALYQVVREQLNISKSAKWLHVGDNRHADIAAAKAQGIEALHADWATVDNRWSPDGQPQRSYFVRSIVEFLSQPQSRSSYPDEAYAAIGYRCFGPVIFGFMLWLLARVREAKLNKLVFVARDGWLPFELFKSLQQDAGLDGVEASYIYFSRQAGLFSGIKGWDASRGWPSGGREKWAIDRVLASAGLDVADFPHVLERHGFKAGEMVASERYEAARRILAECFETILKMSRAHREKVAPYLGSHFTPGQKTGIVDIGWNGNIQRYLIDSLDSRFSKEQFSGLFLGLHDTAKENRDRGMAMQGWLLDFGNPPHVQRYLQSGGVELLEFALTADHGTTLGFERNEQGVVLPVLEELQLDEAIYRERALKLQGGIRKFVQDYRFLLREFDPAVISSTAWGLPFERLVLNPTHHEIKLLADLTHSDTVGHTSSRAPLAARQSARVRWLPGARARARAASFWKAAFDRLNS